MLTESVYMYIKNIGLFFHEGPHPTVPSVKMADALASYISNYKFQHKVINVFFSYTYTDVYTVCFLM